MSRFVLALLLAVSLEAADQAVFPYGAVYFPKSNPPGQDWARDHNMAAQIGMNTFRRWFLWSAIEVPELITAAPEWVFRQYPRAHFRAGGHAYSHFLTGTTDQIRRATRPRWSVRMEDWRPCSKARPSPRNSFST